MSNTITLSAAVLTCRSKLPAIPMAFHTTFSNFYHHRHRHPDHVFIFLLLFLHFFPTQAQPSDLHPDALPLLSFKSSVDTSNRLSTWNLSSASPADLCSSWYGVSCLNGNNGGPVFKLVLEGLNLSGSVPPSTTLTALSHLRVLSLSLNALSGPIPPSLLLSPNFTSLRLLFLSHNHFSGPLPLYSNSSLFRRLYRLDLSYNNLSGPIPAQLNRMSHLLTLRLECNTFSGPISALDVPNLQDFNVSGNDLGGEIPSSLSRFPASSFAENNPALCGAPLLPCKSVSPDPTRPGSGGVGSVSSPSSPGFMVSSSPSTAFPSSKPGNGSSSSGGGGSGGSSHHSKLSFAAIILIVLSDILVLALIALLLCWYFLRNFSSSSSDSKKSSELTGSTTAAAEKVLYSNSAYSASGGPPYQNGYYGYGSQQSQNNGGFERGKLVFFEGARRFELEDLLRASAEMLGKGAFGTAYKAVLDDGSVVAVKRLKLEGGGGGTSGRRGGGNGEFEERMEVLGRLRHPNLVALKAYYFAKDEKLLVFDYMLNGSLFWLLHGNRGPGRTPLDWTTRLKIAAGAARGVAFIHSSCKSLKLTHGNIKSTNVLIDKAGNARVSDFGLAVFASQTTSNSGSRSSNGYRAPEISDARKLNPKADVYSFGVLLLELLTGKCPWPSLVDGSGGAYEDGVGGGVVDLPRWVQSVVREEWTAEVFDLELMRYRDIEEEMVGLLQIAMACTSSSPDQRPKMSHVAKMIEDIQAGDAIAAGSPSQSQDTTSATESPSMSDDNTGAVGH